MPDIGGFEDGKLNALPPVERKVEKLTEVDATTPEDLQKLLSQIEVEG